MVDVPLWMGTVGDTVDAVELRNGCVSDLSPPGRLQQNIVYIKKVQNEKFPHTFHRLFNAPNYLADK